MSQSSSTERLRPGDWERIRERAEQLEQAWNIQTEQDLASFLPAEDDPLYGPILEELVKTDLGIRRSRGQAVSLDYYLEKYPKLGEARHLPVRLIYEEYRALYLAGEPVDLEHYRQRFPDQFAELKRLVEEQPLPSKDETNLATSSTTKPPTARILNGGDILSVGEGFRLIKCIGSGAFGEVWEVEAPGGFPAAMKIIRRTIDGEEAQRELRALEVIKRLSHPHLLKTQAAWAFQERLVILMELAECTLRDRLHVCKAEGASGIPVKELLSYFQETAEALDYLHSEEALHRDIKPQNLLLTRGHVKVADFGLVRDQKKQRHTESFSGTPGYMSPEAWGSAPCAASDQYSLAVTYAELRLGRWPFAAGEAPIVAHLQGTPELTRLTKEERDVILRGMAKDWKARFPSCQAFVSALRDALPGDPDRYNLRAAPSTRPIPKLDLTAGRAPKGESSPPQRSKSAFLVPIDTVDDPLNEIVSSCSQTLSPFKPTGGEEQAEAAILSVDRQQRKKKIAKSGKPWRWIGWTAAVLLLLGGGAILAWSIAHRPTAATSAASTPSTQPKTAEGEKEQSVPLQVVVIPPGYELVRDDGRDARYPSHIGRYLGKHKAVFVLIPRGPDAPFYLLESKVSNGMFRAFKNPQAASSGDDEFPVFRLTRAEAESFANWLGGSLPTSRQLDWAFGYYDWRDGGREPLPAATVTNKRRQPLPRKITESSKLPPYSVGDLDGNGREWTRDDLKPKKGDLLAVLRGRSFTNPEPLSLAKLDEWIKNPESSPLVQFPNHRSWTTSFRVVIELPKQPSSK